MFTNFIHDEKIFGKKKKYFFLIFELKWLCYADFKIDFFD